MNFIDKTWNKRLKGLPAFLIMLFGRLFEILSDKITTFLVRSNVNSCGECTKILRGFKYRYPNNIFIGNNVEIGTNVIFSSELPSGKIVIKDNVVIGRNCKIDFSGSILIEESVLLSEGVIIQTHDHGFDPRSKPIGRSLTIEREAWLGLKCTILSNTIKIGQNAVVAANAVVTKEVDEYSVYAGMPASKIKRLYE